MIIALQGCAKEASHLPSVFELPVVLVSNTIENSIYNSRRKAVKKYIVTHYDDVKIEIQKSEGVHLNELISIADIDENDHQKAKNQWQKDYSIMFENKQLITESIMQYYSAIYIATSTEKRKTINGFSYTEASNIIKNYLTNNFETFRLAIFSKNTKKLKALTNSLNIKTLENKNLFLNKIMKNYDKYFIEPVIVGIMVAR